MRSRAARFLAAVIACLALGAAGFFSFNTEQQLSIRSANQRTFDIHAREAATLLADLRAAQQAYAAAGQAPAYWIPQVATLLHESAAKVDLLRTLAASADAGPALLDASAAITELANIDKRAREYLAGGEQLMASDVLFTEAGETAAETARLVESARTSERQAFDHYQGEQTRREATALGGAGVITVLMLLLLATAPAARVDVRHEAAKTRTPADDELPMRETTATPESAGRPAVAAASADERAALRAAADLCTAFGQVQDVGGLTTLLGHAARLMDASGLVVWLGNSSGGDLRPVVAHGYGEEVLARMRSIPRTADNAAAAAYRSGALQVVAAEQGKARGAVVAPLLLPEGCVGALTAETRHGSETSEHTQALVAIVAAQLAGVLPASTAAPADLSGQRAASA